MPNRTPYTDLLNVGDLTNKTDLESRNVLLMEDVATHLSEKAF